MSGPDRLILHDKSAGLTLTHCPAKETKVPQYAIIFFKRQEAHIYHLPHPFRLTL